MEHFSFNLYIFLCILSLSRFYKVCFEWWAGGVGETVPIVMIKIAAPAIMHSYILLILPRICHSSLNDADHYSLLLPSRQLRPLVAHCNRGGQCRTWVPLEGQFSPDSISCQGIFCTLILTKHLL